MAGAGVDLTHIEDKWILQEDTLNGHKQMIEKRVKALKDELDSRILVNTSAVAAFKQDWVCKIMCSLIILKDKLKPTQDAIRDATAAQAAIQTMTRLREKFNELKQEADRIIEECKHFDMGERSIRGIDELEQDIKDVRTLVTFSLF